MMIFLSVVDNALYSECSTIASEDSVTMLVVDESLDSVDPTITNPTG